MSSTRNQRLYLASIFVTNVGNSIQFLVTGKLLHDLTGLIGVFAGMVILEHFKSAALSAISGVMTDRIGARRLAMWSDYFLGAVGFLVAAAAAFGGEGHQSQTAIEVAVGVFLINFIKPFYRTATFALVRRVGSTSADPKQNESMQFRLNTRSAFIQQSGYFIGLFLAGILLSWMDPAKILFVDALSYLASGVFLMMISGVSEERHPQAALSGVATASARFKSEIREALVYFREMPRAFSLVLVAAIQIVLLDIYNVCLFKLVAQRFSDLPYALPVFEASYAGGVVLVTALSETRPAFRSRRENTWLSLLGVGVALAALGRSSSLTIGVPLVISMSFMVSWVFSATLSSLYGMIPANLSGRIGGFRGLILGVIGTPAVGLAAYLVDSYSLEYGYLAGTALACVAAIVSWRSNQNTLPA
jgi:hypothetical protein